MASHQLSWLLGLAVLCHLTALLAGQHHGVKKCNTSCDSMTSKIPVNRLSSYRQNQASCGKPAIIFTTTKNRTFCADPKAEWVQEAMKHLDRREAAALSQKGGTFERQIGATTLLAARGTDRSAVSEPRATGESSSQEAQRAWETSPELPPGAAGSWGTKSPSASQAPDGGHSAGPERTGLFDAAAVTTATFSTYQPRGKTPEDPSTQAPPTQTLPTQTLPAQAPSTQTPPTQTLPAQAPSTQTPPTQTPPTQAPSTQAPPTQDPSMQAPPSSHTAAEGLNIGSGGQPVSISGWDPATENSLGPQKMDPLSAHLGPGSVPHGSTVPVSSEGATGREPAASGSQAPQTESPVHATVDHQRLGAPVTPAPDSQAATRRQAVGLLAFLGLLFCLGVAMFAYQSLQGCPRNMAGTMIEGLSYVPRGCGSNSYVLVPV